jgi:hypothetical protein
MGLPKKNGLIEVVWRRAKIEVFSATTSVAETVSDLAMMGMTLVKEDRRCMNSMSLEMS